MLRPTRALVGLFITFLALVPDAVGHQQITNVSLVDGTGLRIARGWIEIEHERIAGIGSGDPSRLSPTRMDGEGLTVVPGFVDTHYHLLAYTNLRSDRALRRYVANKLPDRLRGLLAAGFTTLLSPGDHAPEIFEIRQSLAEGKLTGPRLFATGPMLHAPGDHPAATLCRRNGYCRRKLGMAVRDASTARQAVRALVAAGADMVKVVHDRELRPSVIMNDALLHAVAEEAAAANVPLLAHTRTAADFVRLARLGIARMVHTPIFGRIEAYGEFPLTRPPTLAAVSTLSWTADANGTNRRSGAQRLQQREHGLLNVRYLADQGVPVAFGTDNPPPLGELDFMTEVHLLSEVLSNLEILRSMTHDAAVFLDQASEFGALRVGMRADLVLLEGDPGLDLSALTRVRQVFKAGQPMLKTP